MDAFLDWLKKQGIGWAVLIDIALLAYDLGRRLADRDGVPPEEFAAREKQAMERLEAQSSKLLDELRDLTR